MMLRLDIIRCFAFLHVVFPRDQSMFHAEHCVFLITRKSRRTLLRTTMLFKQL